MDNCWRENKNKYVLSYLSNLVQCDVFKHIYINFMAVGHTHNDVDQLFSVLSKYFDGATAITIEDIHDIISNAMGSSCMKIEHVSTFPDYSGWVNKEKNINNPTGILLLIIIGHTKIGSFYITKFENDKAGIKYKKRMHNETWHAIDGIPYTLIKSNYNWISNMEMVKYKDLRDEIKEFKKHLEAVKERVDDPIKMKILHSYIDNLEHPQAITCNWNMFLFERNDHELCSFTIQQK
jgi:hypothetical protein